nr:GDSL esterase/lipase At1g33811 [Ipomoea batatas]
MVVANGWQMEISPGSTKYWCPEHDDAIKSQVRQCYNTLEDKVKFYRQYTRVVGFDVRHSTVKKSRDKEITLKYMVCNREGFKNAAMVMPTIGDGDVVGSIMQKRCMISNRVGGKAKVVLKRAWSQQRDPSQVPCFFIFGDSLVDNGNNNGILTLARANYMPYGVDFPSGTTGRFTNGRTFVDILVLVENGYDMHYLQKLNAENIPKKVTEKGQNHIINVSLSLILGEV